MTHGDAAHVSALLGALGVTCFLVGPRRAVVAAGLVLVAAAEAGLAYSLVPSDDLRLLWHSPPRLAAVVAAVGLVAGVAWLLRRRPALVPVLVLVAAPFRIPIDLGAQTGFLLLPLYGVLAAAGLALLAGLARGEVRPIPRLLAAAAAAFVALDAISLLWSSDLREGSVELGFFVFPFAVLLGVVARAPFPRWAPRVLAATLVGLAAVFAAIGLWQAATHRLFFAQDLVVANSYTTFFRVTSLFKDPSLYGRHLVVALTVLLVALWLRRTHIVLAVAAVVLLWGGLYFSYSQSSMVTLFVVAVAVTVAAADRRSRTIVLAGCGAFAVAGAAVGLASLHDHSLRKATSGRSTLVSGTLKVFERHPVAGVGVGAQPLASRDEARPNTPVRRNASHATPLTVAAELGVLGLAAYLAFLVAVALQLAATKARDRALALGLGAAYLALVVHSLFYSGFFEDPLAWGIPAAAAAFLAARHREPAPVAVAPAAAAAEAAPAAAAASP